MPNGLGDVVETGVDADGTPHLDCVPRGGGSGSIAFNFPCTFCGAYEFVAGARDRGPTSLRALPPIVLYIFVFPLGEAAYSLKAEPSLLPNRESDLPVALQMTFNGQLGLSIGLVLAFCLVAAALHVRRRFGALVWAAIATTLGLGLARLDGARDLFVQSIPAALAYALFYVVGVGAPIIAVSLWLRSDASPHSFSASLGAAIIAGSSVLPFSLLLAYALLLVVAQYSCAGNNCL